MINAKSIKQKKGSRDVLDHPFLKQLAIEHIQRITGLIWTDYNIHDPGVTLLEILAYAITDLGYRTRNKVPAILATPTPEPPNDTFFGPKEILYNAPVTARDYAKLFLTIDGVKNAQLVPSTQNPDFKGIYDLILEVEAGANQPSIAQQARSLYHSNVAHLALEMGYNNPEETESETPGAPIKPLSRENLPPSPHSHRNLCEELDDIRFLRQTPIRFEISLELASGTYVNKFLAELVALLRETLCPAVRYHQVQDLLAAGVPVEKVFSGPNLPFGRLLDTDMDQRDHKSVLRVSDILKDIMGLQGVMNIRDLVIVDEYNVHHKWICPIDPDCAPVLDLQDSWVWIYNNDTDDLIHKSNLMGKRGATGDLQALKAMHKMALPPPPAGKFLNLEDYYSIQNEFPIIYGVGEAGLMAAEPPRRKGLAKQFKGYLMFFDQVLANYLAQLAHLRQFFSTETVHQSYYYQPLLDIPNGEYLCLPFLQRFLELYAVMDDPHDPGRMAREWQHFKAGYKTWREMKLDQGTYALDMQAHERRLADFKANSQNRYLAAIEHMDRELFYAVEEEATFLDRRNRVLDHLLARFAFDTKVYDFTRPENPNRIREIETKLRILRNVPLLTQQRAVGNIDRAQDANGNSSLSISGVEKILKNLLSIDHAGLAHLQALGKDDFQVAPATAPPPAPIDPTDPWEEIFLADAETENEAMEKLFQYGTSTKHYQLADNGLHLNIVHDSATIATINLRQPATTSQLMALATAKAEAILQWSRKFESMYLVEHLQLRPEKSANFFGFQIYDRSGEMLLFRTEHFKNFERRKATLLQLLSDARVLANYRREQKMPRQFRLYIDVGSERFYGPEIYLSAEACNRAMEFYQRAFDALFTRHTSMNSHGAEEFRLEESGNIPKLDNEQRTRAFFELGKEYDNYYKEQGRPSLHDQDHHEYRADVVLKGTRRIEGVDYEFKFTSRRKIESTADNTKDATFDKFVYHHMLRLEVLYGENVYSDPSIQFITKNFELYQKVIDPYSQILTIIFPAWPTRFQDINFRAFARRLVHSEVPSHLIANIKWLPYDAMQWFEEHYALLHKQRAKLNAKKEELERLRAERIEQEKLNAQGGGAEQVNANLSPEADADAVAEAVAAAEAANAEEAALLEAIRKLERKISNTADDILQHITASYD